MRDFTMLRQYLDRTAARLDIPAAFCVCMHDHKKIFSHCTGIDPEAISRSAGKHFWIYSATKVITAAAAMQMVQEGLLDPAAPVSRYLPAYSSLQVRQDGNTETLTQPLLVEHLMTMQGGFDYIMDPPAVKALGPDATTRRIIDAYAKKPLHFVPGTRFSYSLCLDILGGVMEAAGGMTLGQWMKQRIFDPLGMEHTGFFPESRAFAPQFRLESDGRIQKIGNENFCRVTERYESAGGGLYSTLEDYCTFADAMACGGVSANGERILQPEFLDRLCVNRLGQQSLADFRQRYTRPGYGYGYGVRTNLSDSNPESPGTFGWDGAAGVHVMIDPVNRLSLVYFQHVLDMEILYDHIFPVMDRLVYGDA